MKICILAAVLLASLSIASQETTHETVHPSATPADDSRPNSDKVPDAMAVNVHLRRVIVLRFKYKTDLLAGLQKMIKQENIRNAVILSGFGSVRSYHLHQVANGDFPIKEVYEKNPTGPADIIGMSGAVMAGRLHPHIMLATANKAFGGHLEPGTEVFTFAVVTLGVLDDDVDLSRIDDWTLR